MNRTVLNCNRVNDWIELGSWHFHMKIHTGDKLRMCSLTEKRLTGDKPFRCSECSKQFTPAWNLHHHTKICRGDKPYAVNAENSLGQQDICICIWEYTMDKSHLHVAYVLNSLIRLEALSQHENTHRRTISYMQWMQ